MRLRVVEMTVLAAMVLAAALPAGAVVNIPFPVSKSYATSSPIYVGKITSIDAATKIIEADVVDTAKGTPIDKLLIKIDAPATLNAQLSRGQPLVLLVGTARNGQFATLHIADTWVLAQRNADAAPGRWYTVGEKSDLKRSFPGRTADLVRAIQQLQAGRPALLDTIEERVFAGGAKEIGTLPRDLGSMLAADVNGDSKAELFVGARDGIHLLSAVGLKEITEAWGLKGAGEPLAVGDLNGDGKLDLLSEKGAWINTGSGFKSAGVIQLPPRSELLATAIGHAKEGELADVLALKKDGQFLVYRNPGSADKPWAVLRPRRLWDQTDLMASAAVFGDWDDDGRDSVMVVRPDGITRYSLKEGDAPADFARLTGDAIEAFEKSKTAFAQAAAIRLDVNGDGRPDLLVVTATRRMLLVNRGFGVYLPVGDVAGLKPSGAMPAIGPTTIFTAADVRGDHHQDLLVAGEGGKLIDVANPVSAGK